MSRSINKFALFAGIISVLCAFVTSSNSHAVTGADWNAANIISDTTFFNSGSMSTSSVQNFLNSMVPNCDTWGTQPSEFGGGTRAQWGTAHGYPPPYTCLKDYQQDGRSAAQIITDAAAQYNVSPKVLIVLLQKEQSLVTDTWPLSSQYRTATGYGCPDTAPCDAEYYGFTNQVTKAAFQYRLYASNPGSYRYKAGQSNAIQWNPSASCGSSNVIIQNQATAGLYNYTPYQPNAAALANLYGTGDSCSSYGNRNFWRMWNDWFGSTQQGGGFLGLKTQLSGTGWTGTTVDSGMSGTTGQSRPMEALRIDGDAEYSSYNSQTGWQPTVNNGMVSGTVGQSKPIQAVKINLKGALAANYDLYYRAHVGNVGWLGWTKGGATSGVIGGPNSIEALEIYLTVKNGPAPGSTSDSYRIISTSIQPPSTYLSIRSQVSNVGWEPTVTDGMSTGVSGTDKDIEALGIKMVNPPASGSILYSAHVAGQGWQGYVKDDEVAGTIGQSRPMQAVRITLSGDLYNQYDVWYRGFVEGMGWLDWTNNNSPAGSVGASKSLQSLEVRLLPKGSASLGNHTGGLYNPLSLPMPSSHTLAYSAHVSNIGWMSTVQDGQMAGTTGQAKALEAFRFDSTSLISGPLTIKCEYVSKGLGWVTSSNTTCGTTGQSRPLRAIRLSLPDEYKANYTLNYKVHLSWKGWQNWQPGGSVAGYPDDSTTSYPIEAIMISITEK